MCVITGRKTFNGIDTSSIWLVVLNQMFVSNIKFIHSHRGQFLHRMLVAGKHYIMIPLPAMQSHAGCGCSIGNSSR